MCCDPWWGIISYTMVKEGGLSSMGAFRKELALSIKSRAARIVERYVTSEAPPRPLFTSPERYNVTVRDIRVNGTSVAVGLLAMFAFRCQFLSTDKACLLHPSVIGGEGAGGRGPDIRPPHCGFMGSLNVEPGEKGYCRIIHAAEGASAGDPGAVVEAIRVEKNASSAHYDRGVTSAEEAADIVIEQFREMCAARAPHLAATRRTAEKTPGRNDPCWCGSNKKFKKCHG
ncbi:MAG: hypothetical protein BMS9Abin24_084 [Thermodesulfobacteriota bacterium]|nr:MAG: hypothetical protein BMS9Abin24_084 [Thermodesulfobacteriota bacterium]